MNTQHKTEMLFNFSVALDQPQMEQVAKICVLNFVKSQLLIWNLIIPPMIYDLDSFAWEMLAVPSFKLES